MSIHIIHIKTKHKRFFRIKADFGDFSCSRCNIMSKIHNIDRRLIICRSCYNLKYSEFCNNLKGQETPSVSDRLKALYM